MDTVAGREGLSGHGGARWRRRRPRARLPRRVRDKGGGKWRGGSIHISREGFIDVHDARGGRGKQVSARGEAGQSATMARHGASARGGEGREEMGLAQGDRLGFSFSLLLFCISFLFAFVLIALVFL